jgi:hypothetical protein
VAQYQIVAGDGVGWSCLGDSFEAGPGCDRAGEATVCRAFAEAHELYYQHDVLQRVRVHRKGRVVPASFAATLRTPASRDFGRTFPTPRHLLGLTDPLGAPIEKVLPLLPPVAKRETTVDPDFGAIVRYSFPGLELETEIVDGHEIVGAVSVIAK